MNLNADDAQRLAEILLGADPQGPAAAEESEPEGRLSPGPFGRYRITRLVGAGGMGEVYEAQQESPARRVAIKVVRPGLLSGEVLRRFEHETRILARLEHPGIAPIFEAGRVDTDAGSLPFFAMEYVDGRPLTEFAAKLPLRARLELFLKVCDAVEHAHRKGVIHRDLKPGNILVDEYGRPRVMDFGVARATDSDIRATSMGTELGRLLGTLPYMSPEQVGGDPDELDTRSDVYSLGVVLYELLGGRLPYDLKGEGRGRIPEAVRVIRETEPMPLSSIDRVYRGDLETIVLKALEKERERRYQSVGELGADIRRYLANEPIVARRPSSWYQLRKFAVRNKGIVGSVGFAACTLLTGTVVTGWQAWVANRAVLADAGQRGIAEGRRKEAEAKAEIARRSLEFLAQVFEAGSPTVAMGRQLTIREALDLAADKLPREFEGNEEIRAALQRTIGQVYLRLAEYDKAEELLQSALETMRRLQGPLHPEAVLTRIAIAGMNSDRSRFAQSEQQFREILDDLARSPDAVDPAQRLVAMNGWAMSLDGLGRTAEAKGVEEQVLRERLALLGERHPDTIGAMLNLAQLEFGLGELSSAEAGMRRALQLSRDTQGVEHPDTLICLNSLAAILTRAGRPAEAVPLLEQALEARRRVLGQQHPGTLRSMNNLGQTLLEMGRVNDAISLHRETLALRTAVHGGESPETATSLNNLAVALQRSGQGAEAAPLFRQSLDIRARTLGPAHPLTVRAAMNLAGTLASIPDHQGVLDVVTPLLESLRTDADRATEVGILARRRAKSLSALGQSEDAVQELTRTLEQLSAAKENLSPAAKDVAKALAELYEALGRPEEAAKIHERFPGDLPETNRSNSK